MAMATTARYQIRARRQYRYQIGDRFRPKKRHAQVRELLAEPFCDLVISRVSQPFPVARRPRHHDPFPFCAARLIRSR